MTILSFGAGTPCVDPSAFVALGARLIGDVEIGPEASVWYNCVVRGDVNRIRIGARSNVQDGTVIHCDSPKPGVPDGHPTIIGEEVLIGHMAMVHGCILHRLKPRLALGAQPVALGIKLDRLVERHLAALQPRDDRLEPLQRVLEGKLGNFALLPFAHAHAMGEAAGTGQLAR